MHHNLEVATDPWGVHVERVEIKVDGGCQKITHVSIIIIRTSDSRRTCSEPWQLRQRPLGRQGPRLWLQRASRKAARRSKRQLISSANPQRHFSCGTFRWGAICVIYEHPLNTWWFHHLYIDPELNLGWEEFYHHLPSTHGGLVCVQSR